MKHIIFKPDYDHSILSITNSILNHYGVVTKYKTLPMLDKALKHSYKNIVMMIFDGMGIELLKHHLPKNAFLRQQTKDEVSSVFPCTTTAATTTFYSGLPPIAHGWMGWAPYFKEYDKVIELFRNVEFHTQTKLEIEPVSDMVKYNHIFNQITVATKGRVETSEIFPPFKPNGVKNVFEMCRRVRQFCKKPNPQFILTYWTEPDCTSHEKGPYAIAVKKLVQNINDHIEKMCASLTDTLIVISADHGHLPVEGFIYLDEYPEVLACMDKPLNLDDRCNSFFVKKEHRDRFQKLFKTHFSKDFILMEKTEVFKNNIFGVGQVHPKAMDFIGDFISISKSGKAFRQRIDGRAQDDNLKGSHAGMTRQEMLVPLIMIEKRNDN